jgi:hypothetical protein
MMSIRPAPDLVLYHGRLTMLDRSNPVATAVAIIDRKVSAVGRDEDEILAAGVKTSAGTSNMSPATVCCTAGPAMLPPPNSLPRRRGFGTR